VHWDRILFCAKEAVYKAWFPLTRRWLDFKDVSVAAHPNGNFVAHVHVPCIAGVDLERLVGRWMVGRGLVVAATAFSRCQAPRDPTPGGAA
jgi:4'-phosphopantetheinyl transferase EntD